MRSFWAVLAVRFVEGETNFFPEFLYNVYPLLRELHSGLRLQSASTLAHLLTGTCEGSNAILPSPVVTTRQSGTVDYY